MAGSALAALVLTLLGGGPAAAAGDERAARSAYVEGQRAFRQKLWEQALERFDEARSLDDDPRYQLRYGLTLVELERCGEAIDLLGGLSGLRRSDEYRRDKALVECRLKRAAGAMASLECKVALGDADAVLASGPRSSQRREAEDIRYRAKRCVDRFGTETEAERKAALERARGMSAFRQGDMQGAVEAARASVAAHPTAAGYALLGLASAKRGACEDALESLRLAVGPSLDESENRDVFQAEIGCRKLLAKRAVQAGDCETAAPLLVSLEGMLVGSEERERAESAARCLDEASPLPQSDKKRAEVFRLVLRARHDAPRGNLEGASANLDQAAALTNDPYVRRERALLPLWSGDCNGAAAAVRELASNEKDERTRAVAEVCAKYPPSDPLRGKEMEAYIADVARAMSDHDRGRLDDAIVSVNKALRRSESGVLEARRADWLYEMGDCQAYAAALESLGGKRMFTVRPDERLQACREGRVARWTPGSSSGDDALSVSASSGGPGIENARLWGWVAVGLGAAAGATAGVFAGLYSRDMGPLADANNEYTLARHRSAPAAEQDARLEDVLAAQQRVHVDSAVAWSAAGVGAAALGVGATLLFSDWLFSDGD